MIKGWFSIQGLQGCTIYWDSGEDLVHCLCLWVDTVTFCKLFVLPMCLCRSAQFEHTVVITADGVDILTKLPEEDNL